MADKDTLVLGAVAYDPKVVTIWEGFKDYFIRHGLPFDYVLYSNYERQVAANLAGHVDIAWNSPLAWVREERLARAQGVAVRAIAMRDTDCDLRSVIVVRADGPVQTVADLRGRVVAVGASDSLWSRGILGRRSSVMMRRFQPVALDRNPLVWPHCSMSLKRQLLNREQSGRSQNDCSMRH